MKRSSFHSLSHSWGSFGSSVNSKLLPLLLWQHKTPWFSAQVHTLRIAAIFELANSDATSVISDNFPTTFPTTLRQRRPRSIISAILSPIDLKLQNMFIWYLINTWQVNRIETKDVEILVYLTFKVPLGPEFWYSIFFENSLWLLVTMPNFNSLRWLEVAFFGPFLSRFYSRHYWPLSRKLACELAEVTLEAHLKPSTFIRFTWRGKFCCRRGKISCQLFAVRPWNFRCCSSYKGHCLCCTMLQQEIQPPSWYFASSKPCERTRNGKMDNVCTHTQCKFQLERYFCRLLRITSWTSVSRGLFMSKNPRGRLFHCPFQLYGKKDPEKNHTKGT